MKIINKKIERVIAYVDGFNLYFGMKDAGLDRYKWLDINLLANNLLKPDQELIQIKYFTSRVKNNPDKQKRQSTYIDALEAVNVKIIYGNFKDVPNECNKCGKKSNYVKEKMTDVNIATEIMVDAFQNNYDMAMLISGDSDLTPPIKEVHRLFNSKRVFIAFPPKRKNISLSTVAKGSMILGRKTLMDSQFPEKLNSKAGFVLQKPIEWNQI